jgi:hypothetical protein
MKYDAEDAKDAEGERSPKDEGLSAGRICVYRNPIRET